MRAAKLDVGALADHVCVAVRAGDAGDDDPLAGQERAVGHDAAGAEPGQIAADRIGQAGRAGVVAVENGDVVGRLVQQNLRFSAGVDVHRAVAVEVVGRDVGDGGDWRADGHDFELEAG